MGRKPWVAAFIVILAVADVPAIAAHVDAGAGPPAPAALSEGIDRLVTEALAQGKLPGCVVVIGRTSGVVYQKAFGSRALLPSQEAMTLDTIFDVASLTKPLATASALMVLAEQGKVDLDERAAHYVPEFRAHGKDAITLRQLLTHVSGLPSETPVADFEHGRAGAMKHILALSLKAPPGAQFIYSDVGFLVLEEVIRRVSGHDLAANADEMVFRPLAMSDTGFLPAAAVLPRIAPTEKRNDAWIRGDVHDPRAYRLGGVAGHAGLFSTAKTWADLLA